MESSRDNQELYSMIFNDIGEDEEEELEEDIDPELKAAQDKEVEEFRKRLESIQTSDIRPKISLPMQGTNKFAKV